MEIFQILNIVLLIMIVDGTPDFRTKRESEVRPMKLSWVPLIEPTDLANAQSLMIGIQPLNKVMEENINAGHEYKTNPKPRPAVFQYEDEEPESNRNVKDSRPYTNYKDTDNKYFDDDESDNDEIYTPYFDDSSKEEASSSHLDDDDIAVRLHTNYDKAMANYRDLAPRKIFLSPDRYSGNNQGKGKKAHEASHEVEQYEGDENLPEELIPANREKFAESFLPENDRRQSQRKPAYDFDMPQEYKNEDENSNVRQSQRTPVYDYDMGPASHESKNDNSNENTQIPAGDYDAPLEEFAGSYDPESTGPQNHESSPNENDNLIRRQFHEKPKPASHNQQAIPFVPSPPVSHNQQTTPFVSNQPITTERGFERPQGNHNQENLPAAQNKNTFSQFQRPHHMTTSEKFAKEQFPSTDSTNFSPSPKNKPRRLELIIMPNTFAPESEPSNNRPIPTGSQSNENFNVNENAQSRPLNGNFRAQQERPLPVRQFVQQRELPQNFRPTISNAENQQQKQFLTPTSQQRHPQTFTSHEDITSKPQQVAFETLPQRHVQRPVNLKQTQVHDSSEEETSPNSFHFNRPAQQNFQESNSNSNSRQTNPSTTSLIRPRFNPNAEFSEPDSQPRQTRPIPIGLQQRNFQEGSSPAQNSRSQEEDAGSHSQSSMAEEQIGQQRRGNPHRGLGIGIGFLADIEEPLKQMFVDPKAA